MKKLLKNVAGSVHDRLLNKAKETKRPFNELLQYYAMERFLYRVSKSDYSDRFILKGALMFAVWNVHDSRATMDIDLLGRMKNDLAAVESAMKKMCAQRVEDDGLTFDPESVKAARIVEGADYKGVRAKFRGNLGTARVSMQIDIGFGDPVTPGPVTLKFPTILDFPAPRLRGYRPETSIAEKFEAMCTRGLLNSRMKDFYDIWLLCRRFDFEGEVLAEAIRNTFRSRHLDVPESPMALGPEFGSDPAKGTQWKAFIRKSRLTGAPQELQAVVRVLKGFLGPVAGALGAGKSFAGKWRAPGPWK